MLALTREDGTCNIAFGPRLPVTNGYCDSLTSNREFNLGFSHFLKLIHSKQPSQEARKRAKENQPIPKAKTIGLVVLEVGNGFFSFFFGLINAIVTLSYHFLTSGTVDWGTFLVIHILRQPSHLPFLLPWYQNLLEVKLKVEFFWAQSVRNVIMIFIVPDQLL